MGSQTWHNQNVPPEVEENLAALFPGLSIEEALQHQVFLKKRFEFLFFVAKI